MKFLLIPVLVISAVLSAEGQTRKKSIKSKRPVVRATVTVKADPYKPPIYPNETDDGVWNEYSSKDGKIKLTFPAPVEKLYDDSEPQNDGRLIISMSAYTKNGSYRLLVRPFPAILDNRGIDYVLENSIQLVFVQPRITIVKKTNVFYEGFLGKELIVRETGAQGKSIQYAQFYILNSQLITLIVELDHSASQEKMEPWIRKFFDSLVVKLPARSTA